MYEGRVPLDSNVDPSREKRTGAQLRHEWLVGNRNIYFSGKGIQQERAHPLSDALARDVLSQSLNAGGVRQCPRASVCRSLARRFLPPRLYIPYSISGDDNDGIIRGRAMKVRRFTVFRGGVDSTRKRFYSYYMTWVRGIPRYRGIRAFISASLLSPPAPRRARHVHRYRTRVRVYATHLRTFLFIVAAP